MSIILVLLFVVNGVLTLETKSFSTEEACVKYGQARIEVQQKNPNFEKGIFAGCIESKLQKVELKQSDVKL